MPCFRCGTFSQLNYRRFKHVEKLHPINNHVCGFIPYACQLLAQPSELNRPPIPAIFIPLFEVHFSRESWPWETASNVPALVLLLWVLLSKAPLEFDEGRLLVRSLEYGISYFLQQAHVSFNALNIVVRNLECGVIEPSVRRIWIIHPAELHKKTASWTASSTELLEIELRVLSKSLMILVSLFLVKHGSIKRLETVNSVPTPQISGNFGYVWDASSKANHRR